MTNIDIGRSPNIGSSQIFRKEKVEEKIKKFLMLEALEIKGATGCRVTVSSQVIKEDEFRAPLETILSALTISDGAELYQIDVERIQ
jgi:hypothetical protein